MNKRIKYKMWQVNYVLERILGGLFKGIKKKIKDIYYGIKWILFYKATSNDVDIIGYVERIEKLKPLDRTQFVISKRGVIDTCPENIDKMNLSANDKFQLYRVTHGLSFDQILDIGEEALNTRFTKTDRKKIFESSNPFDLRTVTDNAEYIFERKKNKHLKRKIKSVKLEVNKVKSIKTDDKLVLEMLSNYEKDKSLPI